MSRLTLLALVCGVGLLAASPVLAAYPTVGTPAFPAIGAAAGPNIIFTVNPDLSLTTTITAEPAYDTSDDQYVALVNLSTLNVNSIHLTGNNIFGLEGDGIDPSPNPTSGLPGLGVMYGPTGYEGPGTSFAINNANDGTVFFTDGLGVLQNQYAIWSLEEVATQNGIGTSLNSPEPSTIVMAGVGLFVLANVAWRKRIALSARRSSARRTNT